MNKEAIDFLEVLFASLLFGFLPIMVRLGEGMGTYYLAFFRVLIAAITIFAFKLVYNNRTTIVPFKHERKKLILFAAIHGFIIIGSFLAIQLLDIATAAILIYSSSIWTIIFSALILKEKITKRSLVALAISFTGIIFIISPTNLLINKSILGLVSGLLAGIGVALVYILSKTFKKYDKVSLTFWQNLIAIPFLLPLLFIQSPQFTAQNIIVVISIGSVFTALPFILLFKGIGKIGATRASIILRLDAAFSILFAFLIFHEIPSLATIIGGILISAGAIIMVLKGK